MKYLWGVIAKKSSSPNLDTYKLGTMHDYSTSKHHLASSTRSRRNRNGALSSSIGSLDNTTCNTFFLCSASDAYYGWASSVYLWRVVWAVDGRKTPLWLDWTWLDVGDKVQITESASSYKFQWSSEKLELSPKGIEDYVWPRQWFVCLSDCLPEEAPGYWHGHHYAHATS
jgi:hypothetical protein